MVTRPEKLPGHRSLNPLVEAASACAKALKDQDFDKPLSSIRDQSIIAFGKRLMTIASVADDAWRPVSQILTDVVEAADWLEADTKLHFDRCLDWLHASISSTLHQIGSHLSQTCGEAAMDTVTVKFTMLDDCWADEGSVLMNSALTKAMSGLDLSSELVKIDVLAWASKFLRIMANSGELKEIAFFCCFKGKCPLWSRMSQTRYHNYTTILRYINPYTVPYTV